MDIKVTYNNNLNLNFSQPELREISDISSFINKPLDLGGSRRWWTDREQGQKQKSQARSHIGNSSYWDKNNFTDLRGGKGKFLQHPHTLFFNPENKIKFLPFIPSQPFFLTHYSTFTMYFV